MELDILKNIVAGVMKVDTKELTLSTTYVEDLGADSLDTVELITEFETVFGVKIPDEDAEKIQTVGDAVSYIESKINK